MIFSLLSFLLLPYSLPWRFLSFLLSSKVCVPRGVSSFRPLLRLPLALFCEKIPSLTRTRLSSRGDKRECEESKREKEREVRERERKKEAERGRREEEEGAL
ncbi:hypothetical protein CSUI_006996 [Cystoisospora suis]|uniref:Uncharacterized protein n=1 Tax=Cystoisospora suis TaxID=483139 RepID=A0A2C6KSI7_9APIC|nr:hypothetical protein CSUI_006996 [Cystoisospora suis]